jgi:hypothetical protein
MFFFIMNASLFALFWALPVWVFHQSPLISLILWPIAAAYLNVYFYFNGRRERRRAASVLRRNTALEYRIRSEEVIGWQEWEDEGACWAFQLARNKILFLCGQDFYEAPDFPNDDFSIVKILAEGEVGQGYGIIETRGRKLTPLRIIPTQTWKEMTYPAHFEIVDGRLTDLETILSPLAEASAQ